MALLSGAMRAAAFTGSPRPVDDWIAGRQWGLWRGQWERPAPPRGRTPTEGAGARAALEDLHARGVIDDAELERLRARVRGA